MIKLLTISLLLSLTTNAQYETQHIMGADTVYLKTGTDSLYTKAGQNWIFKCKLALKSKHYLGFVTGLQCLIDAKAAEAVNRANHTGTQPANTIAGLAQVATSGSYADLSNKPALFSGSYPDLTNKPALFGGSYLDLTNKPTLSTVAGTGSYNDLTNKPAVPSITIINADVTNNNATANTLQDITGLSFPVVAGQTYSFTFVIYYTASATTTGSRHTINGPAFTMLRYRSEYTLTASANTPNNGLTAYNLPAASNASSLTTINEVIIRGQITASANGTVIARFASEISGSAIVAKAKSYVEYQIL